MPRLRRPLFVVLLLAGVVPAVLAGDHAMKPSPADRYRAAVAALPAPSEADAFSFECEMWVGGAKVGHGHFSAEPGVEDGKPIWKVDEVGGVSIGDHEFSTGVTAELSRTLAALSGRVRLERDGKTKLVRFTRTDSGFHVAESSGEEDPVERDVVCPEGATSSISATILFCRSVGSEPGEYETPVYDADPDDVESVEPQRIVVEGKSEWQGREALLCSWPSREGTDRIAFDPETRALLGLTVAMRDGLVVEFRPAGAAAPAPADADGFTPPAKDPLQAAMIAALAFGTHDADLLDAITDWPSVVDVIRAKHPDRKYEVDKVRRTVLAHLAEKPPKEGARELLLAALGELRARMRVEREGDDRAVVSFPPGHRSHPFVVGRIGDDWYLVELPH